MNNDINPDSMTKEEFVVRISDILAEGFLRYKTRQNKRKNKALTTGIHSPLKRLCGYQMNKKKEIENEYCRRSCRANNTI